MPWCAGQFYCSYYKLGHRERVADPNHGDAFDVTGDEHEELRHAPVRELAADVDEITVVGVLVVEIRLGRIGRAQHQLVSPDVSRDDWLRVGSYLAAGWLRALEPNQANQAVAWWVDWPTRSSYCMEISTEALQMYM
jgi:hypothetical protein